MNADYVIFSEFNNFIQLLGAASADLAEERVIDLISIRDDLIEITRDRKKNLNVKEGDIIFAEDIAPAMMVTLSHLNIGGDRKSTRLNSSHVAISYAVFCLKKKRMTKSDNEV